MKGGDNSKYQKADNASYDRQCKFLMLGEASVGKTSLVVRYTDDDFDSKVALTVGVDFKVKNIQRDNGERIRVQIWDTAGVERFRSITKSYFKGANGVILVYDVTSRNTFDMVTNWTRNVEQYCSADIHVVLVGNKSDLEQRTVSYEEGKELADKLGLGFYEASAKTGEHVDELFNDLIEKSIESMALRSASFSHSQVNLEKKDGSGGSAPSKSNCC
eukprot:TRINITY_DN2796_c0_g1_i1.p1 TRINITY_DN2796_c0_g1~~TRINITY_DN2796_c0_g1_i1.p1  ORF type:complete len:217 (-),score=40.64 TRINITY_DN2796_c0_g1_i1:142-792(-)